MAKRQPEQDLINQFIKIIKTSNPDIRPIRILNENCRAKKTADIEFETEKFHWIIEAKSNNSGDAHNSVHKLFGELLKETGRERKGKSNLILKYAILIPDGSFYQKKLHLIEREKYMGFGKLIPVDSVFLIEKGNLKRYTWSGFYDSKDFGLL